MAAVVIVAIGFAIRGWIQVPSAPVPGASVVATSGVETAGLPDPRRTPGAIDPSVMQDNIAATICKAGWSKTVRPPAAYTNALKVEQILQYGYADRDPRHYQEDHLVPLELGGAPRDTRNLWPEPVASVLGDGSTIGSKQKDALEDYLHGRVCAHTIALADAQRAIAGDWIAAWRNAGLR